MPSSPTSRNPRPSLKVLACALTVGLASTTYPSSAFANDDLIRFGIGIGTQLLINEVERRQRQAPPANTGQRNRGSQSQATPRKSIRSQRDNVVFQLQSKLKDLGFDPGPLDGDWGRKTENALVAWQESIGEDGTGVLTDPQRTRLGLEPKANASATNGPAATDPQSFALDHTSAEASISDSPISGVWQGELSCSSGSDIRDVVVGISGPADNRFTMTLDTFRFFGGGSSEAFLSYVGEYEPASSRYFFVLVESQASFGDMKPDQILVSIDSSGNPLVNLVDEKCAPLILTKADPRRSPQYALTTPAIPNGMFFSSDDPRLRCQAIIDWAARLEKERSGFPKGIEHSIVPLFFDEWFIPTFGRPYDGISPQEFSDIYYKDFSKLCNSDPIIKARIAFGARIMKNAFANLSGERVSKYYFAAHQVTKNRVLRHKLRDMEASVDSAADSHEAFANIEKLLVILEQEHGNLWPSEVTGEKSVAERKRLEIAKTVVEDDLLRTEQLANPSEVLEMSSSYLTRVREAHSFLPEGERKSFGNRYAAREEWAVQELSEPVLTQARKLVPSLDSVRRARDMSTEVSKLIKSTNISLQTNVRNAFRQIELDLISPVVAQDVQTLRSYPSGKPGLKRVQSWRDSFEGKYKDFQDMPPVADARSTFIEVRAERMVDSIADFEAEVEQIAATSPADQKQFDALLAEYLFDPEMRRTPISLEYLFLVEASKAKSQM